LGSIGLEIGRYLVKEYGARLLLIGRTPLHQLDAEKQKAVTELQARYAVTDISDVSAIEQAVAAAETFWNTPLGGVLHLAGVYRERLIADETAANFAATLAPKVGGTIALRQMLQSRPGAFLVGFSSINSFFGGFSSGSYAAANAFLDASVAEEHANGRRAISIAWSLWDEVGMSRGYALKELSRSQGYLPISRTQGLRSFLVAMQSAEPLLLIGLDAGGPQVRRRITGELQPLQKLVVHGTEPERGSVSLKDRFKYPLEITVNKEVESQADHGSSTEPASDLERDIGKIWSEVLGTEVDLDGNFFDLGGSSVLGAQVYRKIHDLVGDSVTLTDLFQFPTVRTLCRHLACEDAPSSGRSKAEANRGRNSRERLLRRRGGADA
jgi:hypothetical protein